MHSSKFLWGLLVVILVAFVQAPVWADDDDDSGDDDDGIRGDITAVLAGQGLSGGGDIGDVTLRLDLPFTDGRYAILNADNFFTGSLNSFEGNMSISSSFDGGLPFHRALRVQTFSDLEGATAVIGQSLGDSDFGVGVMGTNKAGGFGVRGHATDGIGVFGTVGPGGAVCCGEGVRGTSTRSGFTAGVSGVVQSPDGIAGYFINDGGGRILTGDSPRGTEVFSVQGDGTVFATAFVPTSSLRFKTSIQPVENALDTVRQLRGVSFEWKTDGRRDIGLIAEEVGSVVPEVVTYEENGKDAKGVNYDHLTALLVEAIKEQQTQIDLLRAEVESLRAGASGR